MTVQYRSADAICRREPRFRAGLFSCVVRPVLREVICFGVVTASVGVAIFAPAERRVMSSGRHPLLSTRGRLCCHSTVMKENAQQSAADSELRPGEVAVELPSQTDAGVFFIGAIRTPWRSRRECPKRGSPDGPICSIVVDERWRAGLTDLTDYRRIQVLYWMHQARRDLVLQTPFGSGKTTGTFALRSPVRPNPIASSLVELISIDGTTLQVRGLDCLDGTPLLDLKPDFPSASRT